jgi:hypothetical protein
MAGAVVGGLGAGATGGNTSTGVLAGAAAGALIGGVVGMVKDSKERKEQDRLAQERAYQQELARKRAEEAKRKAEIDEELAVTQGFRISSKGLQNPWICRPGLGLQCTLRGLICRESGCFLA